MSDKKIEPVKIKGARLIFRNFAGNRTQFNDEGRRNFCVILSPEVADDMMKDGWNVKMLKPRDESDSPQPYIQVKVNYNSARPPKIVMMTGDKKTNVTEDMVQMLDWAEIEWADIIVNPYVYEKRDGSGQGVSAYLKTMYASIVEDELEAEYADCGHVCDGNCEACSGHHDVD